MLKPADVVAYSFKKRFEAPIVAGTKRQTIRAQGKKRHAWPLDLLQLYTGMRKKHCRLIGRATAFELRPIKIRIETCFVELEARRPLRVDELDAFARADGFVDWPDMAAFWRRNAPGEGAVAVTMALIMWRDFTLPDAAADTQIGGNDGPSDS